MKYFNKTKEEIRVFYFKGKLNKFLDEISAENNSDPSELIELAKFLDTLKEEKMRNKILSEKYDGSLEPPKVGELLRMTEPQKEELKKWLKTTEGTIHTIKEIMNEMRLAIQNRNRPKRDEMLDTAMSVICLMFSLDQYEIVNEQLYRAELTKLMDNFSMSRAEAEGRAKLTPEYREYKKARRLKEQVLEFEMMAKKIADYE